MKPDKRTAAGIFFVMLSISFFGFELNPDGSIPKGWIKAGTDSKSYEVGIEKGAGNDGSNAAYIKSIKADIKGFGVLLQGFSAEKYLGKRVRLSGYMKSKDVENSAGFVMRIENEEDRSHPLGFDNMSNRPVKGNTDWKIYQVVLDVPENSTEIMLGGLLTGKGQVWFSNLKFEVVDKSVPTTDLGSIINDKGEPVEPTNLNFQD
ncbi:MAG TPA: hypothetical protein VHO03_03400 [Ignavibacteriales bacterium]|nr:hypothetical protein [Ignavibacteriales bacterium]